PEEVFGEAWTPVVTDGSGRDRAPLRRAVELLRAAGWERRDGGLFNAAGEQLTLEFLYAQPTWERVLQPYANRLGLLGIPVSLRMVESAQYQSRLNTFDFEMTTRRYAFAPTPGESIREFWTSQSAAIDGSFNIAGIANPAIDALTETLINAPSRDEMVVAARALDRVLRAGHYSVPQWYNKQHNIAYWDRFGIPEMKPKYFFPVETTWWSKA
ncbi:MAG: ABC transporter substrate-binding protein, partial [Pseudomonadota bacterium]